MSKHHIVVHRGSDQGDYVLATRDAFVNLADAVTFKSTLDSASEPLIISGPFAELQFTTPVVRYTVVVGNVGTVYDGTSRARADGNFNDYVKASKAPFGRAAGEHVVMMADDEIVREHVGSASSTDEP